MSKSTTTSKRRRVESYAGWCARIDSEVEAAARTMNPSTVENKSLPSLPRISAVLTLARKNIPPEYKAETETIARQTLTNVIQILTICLEEPDLLSHERLAPYATYLAATTDWLQTAIMILTGRRSCRTGLARLKYE